jgi:hypothetical protein
MHLVKRKKYIALLTERFVTLKAHVSYNWVFSYNYLREVENSLKFLGLVSDYKSINGNSRLKDPWIGSHYSTKAKTQKKEARYLFGRDTPTPQFRSCTI